MQLAQLGVAFVVVLDRLVKKDRAEMRLARRVVQPPVVGVVDDLVVGDRVEREAGVLGDEAQHAARGSRAWCRAGRRSPRRTS